MLSIKDKIDEIKKVQRTVDEMIDAGILSKYDMHFQTDDKEIEIDILYQKDATIGLGECKARAIMPEHSHKDSFHYLICVSGRFIIKLCGTMRVLSPGECVSIPKGVPHSTQCIKEGKLIFVNVPADDQWGFVNGRVH